MTELSSVQLSIQYTTHREVEFRPAQREGHADPLSLPECFWLHNKHLKIDTIHTRQSHDSHMSFTNEAMGAGC